MQQVSHLDPRQCHAKFNTNWDEKDYSVETSWRQLFLSELSRGELQPIRQDLPSTVGYQNTAVLVLSLSLSLLCSLYMVNCAASTKTWAAASMRASLALFWTSPGPMPTSPPRIFTGNDFWDFHVRGCFLFGDICSLATVPLIPSMFIHIFGLPIMPLGLVNFFTSSLLLSDICTFFCMSCS